MLMTNRKKLYIWKVLALATLFVMVLTGLRLLWITIFKDADQPPIVGGTLDLRNWDFSENPSLTLDGEWEFYPYTWLVDHKGTDAKEPQYIAVPGSWDALLNPEDPSPYGYGSYRLRILVDPTIDTIYGIRIPSVRSASELYVNGQLLEASGKVGESEVDSVAWNIPYSSPLLTNDDGVIEVVIQATNFIEPRDSGIPRSLKFGTKDAIHQEIKLSENLQLTSAAVFLVHVLFACVLYFVGFRDKRLLYFAMVTVSAMLINLLATDEKILLSWLPVNYSLAFRFICLSMLALAYALVQCVKPQLLVFSRKLFQSIVVFYGIVALLTIILPLHYLVPIPSLYFLFIVISAIIAFLALPRTSLKRVSGDLLLVLAILALVHSFAWWGILIETGIKVVYYPFDLIIGLFCLSALWFRNYHQAHIETKKLTKKLQQADKLKDEFLANTSHELRNPLHGMLNVAQAVLERESQTLSAKSLNDMGIVLSVGRRMSFLLNDLLDVASLKGGNPKLQRKTFSIQTLISGVMDMLTFMMKGKPVRFVNEIPDDFPPLFADENRVIQVLFNLLHNATKYTDEGEITIKGYVKGKTAYIAIEDTGMGMDEEMIQRVFTPYEQGRQGESMIEGGLGLGLSISKKLVELHGGALHVHSIVGVGSEFTFTLPIADVPLDEEREITTPAVNMLTAASFHEIETQQKWNFERPRILVVDDDPINLQVIQSILSSNSYDIMTVTNGEKALATLHTKEWDLVISDVMMPQVSGYELTKAIRQHFSMTELPVLLLTARNQPIDIENGFLAGANDYVTKPVDTLELRSRVRALTSVKQSMRERLQMEAAWLQAQIQPHFLFNALNTVIALSGIDVKRMHQVLEAFSRLLRGKFQFSNINEFVPIEQELDLIRNYLLIEQERFGDRLRVIWELDDLVNVKIPSLTIQPLVENAIRHGLMQRVTGGQLTIRISTHDTYVEIAVEDDGIGMEEAVVKELLENSPSGHSGIGLLNTDLRLKRLFGKGLHITSAPNQGTTVSFIVNKATQ